MAGGVGLATLRRSDGRTSALGGALLVGLALRIAIGLTDDAPATDETAYLRSGISLVEGHGYSRGAGLPELHFPPLVPFLLGLASRMVSDPHTGTVVLTALTGAALVVPLALLAGRLAGDEAQRMTAWFAALAPALATMPSARGGGSEMAYCLLVVTALWLLAAAFGWPGRRAIAAIAAAGLLVGLSYLTRPEGLLFAVPIAAAIVVGARRGRWSMAVAGGAFLVPLMLCVGPYASFLHHHTAEWQLTAKTHDVSIESWHAVARGDREARDRVLYALDPAGQPVARESSSLPTLARSDPGGYLGILGANLRTLAKNVVGWWLLPLPVWLLAGLGAWRTRSSSRVRLLVVVAAVPVATSLAFFVQPRYLVVTAALATVFAGVAVSTLSDHRRRLVVPATALLLVGSSVGAFYGEGGFWHPGDHTDQRRAGEWIATHTDAGDVVMTRSFVVDFYAERPTLAIPYADMEQILEFGRRYGAQYLVADTFHVGRLRPQLAELFDEDRVPGLRLVHEARQEGRTSRVFAFDPAPPPSDEAGPSLGFMGDNTFG